MINISKKIKKFIKKRPKLYISLVALSNIFADINSTIRTVKLIIKLDEIFLGIKLNHDLTVDEYVMIIDNGQYGGTGDLFWTCSLLNKFMKEKKIEELTLLIANEKANKIIKLFNLENIKTITLNSSETSQIDRIFSARKFSHLTGESLKRHHIFVSNLSVITGNKCFCYGVDMFITMLAQYLFNVSSIRLAFPLCSYKMLELPQSESDKNDIKKIKKVVLAPKAHSTGDRTETFWTDLARFFTNNEYEVYTNIGSEEEDTILNTLPLKCNYREAIEFVGSCTVFVGLRSGFCDIIIGTNTPKIIIYPDSITKYTFTFGSLCNEFNISEYIVNEENYEKMAQKIIDQIENKYTIT